MRSPDASEDFSTKEPNTVLGWPITSEKDNQIGPIYPPHKTACTKVLDKRVRDGLWPSDVRDQGSPDKGRWKEELRTGKVLHACFDTEEMRKQELDTVRDEISQRVQAIMIIKQKKLVSGLNSGTGVQQPKPTLLPSL